MRRSIYTQLEKWRHSDRRKPLILRGARQVGKTYALETFASEAYEDTIYMNFEEKPQYANYFVEDIDPDRILKDISLSLKKPIHPGKTLLIFDEIQECPNALNSLKYFCEKRNDIHIAAAGSLLGVKLSKGFPVGKVNFIELAPMSFFEFLQALEHKELVDYLGELKKPKSISLPLHEQLIKLLKYYFIVGGMPEAVHTYIKTENLVEVRNVQAEILDAYMLDFAKHAPKSELTKIMTLWDLLPSQLGKENKKFVFSAISKSARAGHYENAIQWLLDAGLIHRVCNTTTPKLPLDIYANRNIFKIYALDVGLLGKMSKLEPEIILEGNALFQEFKGALTENFVLQELSLKHFKDIYYWTSEGKAEVDFLISFSQKIYPLEVKAGISKQKKSLKVYGQKYLQQENHVSILSRSTLRNFTLDDNILNYPLYAISLFPSLGD